MFLYEKGRFQNRPFLLAIYEMSSNLCGNTFLGSIGAISLGFETLHFGHLQKKHCPPKSPSAIWKVRSRLRAGGTCPSTSTKASLTRETLPRVFVSYAPCSMLEPLSSQSNVVNPVIEPQFKK